MTLLDDSELASVYALTKMRISERDNFDLLDEYFDAYYDIDVDKVTDLFLEMSQDADALTNNDAYTIALNFFEMGFIYKEYRGDINLLGGTDA